MREFKVFVITLLVTVYGLAELYLISLFGGWAVLATVGICVAYFGCYPEDYERIRKDTVSFMEEP